MFRRGFTLVELLVVIAVIALLIAMLLPALANAKAQGHKSVCAGNQRQAMVALASYAADAGEYPSVMSWAFGPDLNNNGYFDADESGGVSDGLPGGLSVAKSWGNGWGVAQWVLLRQKSYIGSYKAAQCGAPTNPDRLYYSRHRNAISDGGYFFPLQSPDHSLYSMYENPSGNSLVVRLHGNNPFNLNYYTSAYPPSVTSPRTLSRRGLSYKGSERRMPAEFPWLGCPGRFVNQGTDTTNYPGSTYGGYGYEPHGAQPLSTIDPLFTGGSPWADFWMVNGIHYVERNIGYGDGHVAYDQKAAMHNAAICPNDIK